MVAFPGSCHSRSRDYGLIAIIVMMASTIVMMVVVIAIGNHRADNRTCCLHHRTSDADRGSDHGAGCADRRAGEAGSQRHKKQEAENRSDHGMSP